MPSHKKNVSKNEKSQKEKKEIDEAEKLIEGEPTLLTSDPESTEDLLFDKTGGELLKPESNPEEDLLLTDIESEPTEEGGILLGTEKSLEKDEDNLLLGGSKNGELLTADHLSTPAEAKTDVSDTPISSERRTEEIIVAFDANLNERGKINESYLDLKHFLEQNNIKCIEYSDVLTQTNLAKFDCFVFACPDASRMNKYEIGEIVRYVQNGGNLLLLSHAGGDRGRGTNLNELSQNFGFRFVNDQVFDEVHNIGLNSLPIIDDFLKHPILKNIQSICYRAGCSIEVSGTGKLIAHADSIAEPTNAGVIAINTVKLGRVIALGSYEMFRNQMPGGINYETHKKLFLNIIDWLTEKKNEARFIQSMEKIRSSVQKHVEKHTGKEATKVVGKKSTFSLPVLPPKQTAGIEDIDGILYGFKELSKNFADLKEEVENSLNEMNSIAEGISMGSVREIEKLKEEFIQFKEDNKDSQEAMTSMFMEMGKGIESLNNKLDKLISTLKKKK
ncbi:MAG: hypothetical protein ACTSRG_03930 [Candidatus Helarchaeota archaeon]